jgi:hypothetical protein
MHPPPTGLALAKRNAFPVAAEICSTISSHIGG